MIKTETAFVLGAGASAEYGFPLGWGLVQEICRIARSEGTENENAGYFADKLSKSGKLSIDAFLEHRPDLIDLGKSFIAKALIPHEKPDVLFTTRASPGWYRLLFDKMNCSYEEFANNKVKFITYNYDRSIEHFLTSALAASYGKSPRESWSKVQKIGIIHVHGCLGKYDPGVDYGNGARPYSERVIPAEIETAVEQLKVVHEGHENTEEYKQAREVLKWARRIFFIGFGYSHEAIKRLQPQLWADRTKQICGTAFGLKAAERIKVLRELMPDNPRAPATLKTYPLDLDRAGKTAFTPGHTWPALDTSDIDAANFIRRIPDLAED